MIVVAVEDDAISRKASSERRILRVGYSGENETDGSFEALES